MTLNELCKCFDGFSKDSRVLVHFATGNTAMYKWKEGCNACYTVERFSVVSITKNIIVLEVWN